MTSDRNDLEALAAEGLDYFENAGDDGDRKYVAAIRKHIRRLTPPRSDAPAGGGVAMPEPAYPACKHLTFCEGAEEPLYTADQVRSHGDARAAASLARLVNVGYATADGVTWYTESFGTVSFRPKPGTELYTLTPSTGTEESGDA
jgi:hypothetical protein